MLGSKNKFFFKTEEQLNGARYDVEYLLAIKGYSVDEIKIYLDAFDFFAGCPQNYDGATIVKDLVDVPGLDLDSMLHDYHYYVYDCASNLKYKHKADWIFAKGMERKGKGSYSTYSRFFALATLGFFFMLYVRIKRGKMDVHQKKDVDKHYSILIR